MAVMVTDINTKCNTVVHDNIYSTKCNTIVVTVLLLWSCPGNSAKYNNIIVTVTKVILWLVVVLYCCLCSVTTTCFQVVCLSIPSVLTLCLKDPQLGNNSIHPELLTVDWYVGASCLGVDNSKTRRTLR